MLFIFSMFFSRTYINTFETAAAGSVTATSWHKDKMVQILVSDLLLLVKFCLKFSFKSAPLLADMNFSLH